VLQVKLNPLSLSKVDFSFRKEWKRKERNIPSNKGLSHGREWLASSTAAWCLTKFLEDYEIGNERVTKVRLVSTSLSFLGAPLFTF